MNHRFRLRAAVMTLVALVSTAGLYSCASTKENRTVAFDDQSTAGGLEQSRRRVVSTSRPNAPGSALRESIEDVAPALGPVDEIWIIARVGTAAAAPDDNMPRAELRARFPDREEEIPLPLQHTEVHAQVSGYVASVNLTQQYENPYAELIEAVYVFPLPENGAVSEFVMTVGARRIRGIVRERDEAERMYAEAKHQGYVTSLLTQSRPNIFTQSVANIEPGKRIDIEMTYFHVLHYDAGEYEFVFPMVVGPRFNPPGSRDGVGAVTYGNAGGARARVEIPYLRSGLERSGHDIMLTVDLDAGVTIEALSSPSHAIETERISASRRQVSLSRLDTVPNKDFVLRYRVAGDGLKSGFLSHRDARGGFFTLMLEPPVSLPTGSRAPLELVFVIDCSGSMSGYPIEKAKAVMERALRRLGPDDTFQVVRFSDTASQFGDIPVPATAENVHAAIDYVRGLHVDGGTMMINGIRAALDFEQDPRRLRIVSFMTDGFIGNEAEILAEISRRRGKARIFSFGIGSSVNRYLLDSMARIGHGAVAYIGAEEGAERAVDAFYESMQYPVLTDIRIDWGGLAVSDVYPRRIPDLLVGRPVVVSGRIAGHDRGLIRVRGQAAGTSTEIRIPVDVDSRQRSQPALANIWARTRLAELDAEEITSGRSLSREIKEVALEFGLVSKHTSFIAVDSKQRTAATYGTTVTQPVPMPVGVRYETNP